ncbi:hypothetical protein E6C76_20510 [Pseudothauera nasutitermitis]|uniref:Uncharacterized protein n=1 Tax=Pseudothauera nasutitermitis TaxID=2565930 RepID=A0A4S4ASH8_9RHOO|nr:hypothetical protein [Pseudothauera nasutitermitis]THF61464.1 hypothetical protein E6C76_20510 [Pseudothauera nasutitermitis]
MSASAPPQTLSRPRAVGAAWAMGAMIVLSIFHGAGWLPAWPAGVAGWMAGALLWPRLDGRQRRFTLGLAAIGALALGAALWQGLRPDWMQLLTQNTALLGMLAAVSFLQMVGLGSAADEPPRGARARWLTLGSVHLFGAVINMSAVFIMAERMAADGRLGLRQAAVLTRGFLAAALWSPFFAAMAVVLTYAPGASLGEVILHGVPLALGVLWLAGRLPAGETGDPAAFVGYPMRLAALWLPVALSVLVIAGHAWLPGWTSLAIIGASALALSLGAAVWQHGPREGAERVLRHAGHRLPAMSGELVLFLCAGVFATGLQALMSGGVGWMPFGRFGALEAAMLLAGMIVLSALGIHAVVCIVMAAAWLAPLAPDPLLMALVFLQCWAIGLALNPMAGVHLSLQGRFGLSGLAMARGNLRYGLASYALGVAWLFAVEAWRAAA